MDYIDYTGAKFSWKDSNYIVLVASPVTLLVQCQMSVRSRPVTMSYQEFRDTCKNVW